MHCGARAFLSSMILALALVACAHRDPPTPANVDAAVAPLPPASAVVDAAAPLPIATDAGAITLAVADSGVDPGALPQTRDRPKATTFDPRGAALWDAIASDDPERAIAAFFPVTAYEQVKAITYPAADWRRRLVAAFKRDIHALHKRLGDNPEEAKLVRLEIPDDRARWVEPDEESNKLGYWRVYGTRIVYERGGKERSFDISSLISWRGEWYVVHLTGFK